MDKQKLIKHLNVTIDNLWYAKHSADYSSDYINAVIDTINYILKELGE